MRGAARGVGNAGVGGAALLALLHPVPEATLELDEADAGAAFAANAAVAQPGTGAAGIVKAAVPAGGMQVEVLVTAGAFRAGEATTVAAGKKKKQQQQQQGEGGCSEEEEEEEDAEFAPARVFESEAAAAGRVQREQRLEGVIAGVFQLKKVRRMFAKEEVPKRAVS